MAALPRLTRPYSAIMTYMTGGIALDRIKGWRRGPAVARPVIRTTKRENSKREAAADRGAQSTEQQQQLSRAEYQHLLRVKCLVKQPM